MIQHGVDGLLFRMSQPAELSIAWQRASRSPAVRALLRNSVREVLDVLLAITAHSAV